MRALPGRTNAKLYSEDSPLGSPGFEAKARLLEAIDAYARAKDPRVRQVSASLRGELAGGRRSCAPMAKSMRDVRPLVRVGVSVMVGDGDRQETRQRRLWRPRRLHERFITTEAWQGAVDNAVRQALVNLQSVPAPAGEMDVVLGPGWPGVMLHEAVGHGLEGDFNRKKTSAFAGLMGQQVASKGVTVVDDGTMAVAPRLAVDRRRRHADQPHRADRRRHPGRLHAGPPERALDGNESHRQRPPRKLRPRADALRMTNTYMLAAGDREPGREILASVKNGIYADAFPGGGQVDITSGKYVFQCTEAYRIENGKIGAPIKGCHADPAMDRPTCASRLHGGQRPGARQWHRHRLRQERPGRAGPASASRRCASIRITVGSTG